MEEDTSSQKNKTCLENDTTLYWFSGGFPHVDPVFGRATKFEKNIAYLFIVIVLW